MNKVTFYVILLHSLLLGIGTAGAESLPTNLTDKNLRDNQKAKPSLQVQSTKKNTEVNKINTEPAWKKLPSPQVWVINQQQKPESQPFAWVVENTKKAQQQPFLEVGKAAKKPGTKPSSTEKPSSKDDLEPFDEVVKDTEKKEGLFTLYRNKKKNKIYLEIKPEQLNDNYLATATLESGIGERGIYSGMPLQDFLFYWQRVDNKLQFIVRNVNFRTREGDPQARSLARSFSDSTLYMLDIKSIHPQRKTILVDLGDLLLSDLAGLSSSLGVTANSDQSYFGDAKAFPHNVEIESVLNFSSGANSSEKEVLNSVTLPDSRGYTLRVHYSFSQLPNNGYRPRLADERVGYFITAYQDLTKDNDDPFVRYINRWHLEKEDPKAAISRPKKPIVFWIDNAVPLEYRDAIKEGILMWNKAFLKAGFKDAIEARQRPDDATWDPADIRYNTIRWINTVDGYFAMGPSRVNPLTGEILDADILVDASFVRALKSEYRKIIQPSQNENRTSLSAWMQNRFLCSSGLATKDKNPQQPEQSGLLRNLSKLAGEYDLCYGMEAANQFAFGSLAMTLLPENKSSQDQLKEYIHQYLRLIIAHEVGHTLGLRHNFRGSTLLSPQDMNNKEITQNKGLTTSVMDYIPPNIAPQGTKQGDYFPNAVGAYDDWAIQYGYEPFQATTPIAEKSFLQDIANQSYKPEYSYSTDEDVYDLDPTADAWDNSNNVLVYSQWQLDNSRVMWDRLNKGYPTAGESYSDVSERFSTVLGNYFQQIYYVSKYIGGQSFYRVKGGDVASNKLSNGQNKLPFEPVPVEEQREALKTLQKYVFAEDALKFSPDLLNKLAPSRWRHWGSYPRVGRLDYPIHELVLFFQSGVLRDLLSGDRLYRLKDLELKNQPEKALTLPELFDTLQNGIWTEVIKPQGSGLQISSLRRGLQREYLDILIDMVLRKQYVPEDARTLAWYKLKQLDEKLAQVNSNDEYSKAHILETRDRIEKALNAQLQGN
ncbi:zinc-dependent metalloprotease [Nostoc sp. FACHB-152]|uniref:zinc-dependent metalloprotease n=1 Tax=unclassified Nostoc TaxID=2593658 RepID=UPI00168928C0|nr:MULTISPECIES: zinc-dependent metalloprotease [unclassified Nostoc]MBD2446041.1 zinc-dependent metalloprotease [Nostoc sp. FACHB-152]MBD2467273.1 zinc-dependent metalloprotease [Nostoc sp. FACHB-145]